MNEVVDRFLEYLEINRHCTQNTILAYQTDVRQFVQVLTIISEGPIEPNQIEVDILNKYVSWLNRQGYKTATIARKIAAVRTFLDYMGSHEGVDTRALLNSLGLPKNPRQPPKVLTTSEIDK